MSAKRPFDGPDAHCSERGGDDENVTADDAEVGELAKRLRIPTLVREEDPEHRLEATMAVVSSSAPAEQRIYVRSWAYWWNSIEGAWNEGYISVEGNWCRPDRQFLWDTLWWWDMDHARWSTFQGWRVNPYYVRVDVAVEQSR